MRHHHDMSAPRNMAVHETLMRRNLEPGSLGVGIFLGNLSVPMRTDEHMRFEANESSAENGRFGRNISSIGKTEKVHPLQITD